tara:strand:- start:775 stop:1059 length:285 start_codon:yes stop_codon:yes gene_type:complete
MEDNFKKCKQSFEESGDPKGNLDVLKIVFITEVLNNQTMQGLYELACAGLVEKYKDLNHDEMIAELCHLGYEELLDSYLKDSLEMQKTRLRHLQ